MTGKMRNKRNKGRNNKTEKYKGKQKILNKGRYTTFLEKYKIWFETVMYVTLSICAIIISFEANNISFEANKISNAQLKHDKNKDAPYFYITTRYGEDGREYYELKNSGGIVKEIIAELYFYIKIGSEEYYELFEVSDNDVIGAYNQIRRQLPCEFVFPYTPEGISLEQDLRDYCESKGYKHSPFSIYKVLGIEYTDVNNNNFFEIYFLDRLGLYKIERDELPEWIRDTNEIAYYSDEQLLTRLKWDIDEYFRKKDIS